MLDNLDKYKDGDGEIIWNGIYQEFNILDFRNMKIFWPVVPEYTFGFTGFYPSTNNPDKLIGKLVWGIKE